MVDELQQEKIHEHYINLSRQKQRAKGRNREQGRQEEKDMVDRAEQNKHREEAARYDKTG